MDSQVSKAVINTLRDNFTLAERGGKIRIDWEVRSFTSSFVLESLHTRRDEW